MVTMLNEGYHKADLSSLKGTHPDYQDNFFITFYFLFNTTHISDTYVYHN